MLVRNHDNEKYPRYVQEKEMKEEFKRQRSKVKEIGDGSPQLRPPVSAGYFNGHVGGN